MMKPFFVWQSRVLIKVDPEKVTGLRAEENYTRICLSNNTVYMVRSTLASALKKLPPDMFVRVHRSYVVSVNHIENIARDHLTIGGESVPIGKQFYRSVLKHLNVIK